MNLQHIADRLLFPVGIGGGLISGAIFTFTRRKQGSSSPKLELSLWKKIVLVFIFVAVCFELVFAKF